MLAGAARLAYTGIIQSPEAYVRPITLIGSVCGKTDPALSNGGMSARILLFIEAAPQRPQAARNRVRREIAWHLAKPLLEVAPPQKRVAQEEYRRPPVACNPIVAMTSSELGRISRGDGGNSEGIGEKSSDGAASAASLARVVVGVAGAVCVVLLGM